MIRSAALMALLLAIFGYFPQIDLAVSSWFYDGQWFGRQGILWTIRNFYYDFSILVPVLLLVLLVLSFIKRTQVPRKVYGFFVALAIIAPIGLVNMVLKEYWGRARPSNVVEFGGDKLFTPAQIFPVDQCDHNCSFVSGEGSGCFMLLLLALTMFGGTAKRDVAICALILPMGFLRVVAGGHFLSDVLGSFLVVAFCFFALLKVMQMKPSELRVGWPAFWADVKSLVGVKHA